MSSLASSTRGMLQARGAVLIVDDEPDLCLTLEMILGLEGYIVKTAADGPAALSLLDGYKPDIVVCDFMMPWMNGRELIERIKETAALRSVRTILVSGVDPGPPQLWDHFMRKPVEIDSLLAAIDQLLPE